VPATRGGGGGDRRAGAGRRTADVARRRLAAQHVSSTEHARAADVVALLGAVQAQDYLGALWAVGLRMTAGCEADVERALADGSIVRTWPLRGTLHFVAPADARWILDLLGDRCIAAAAGRFRALGLDDASLARARRVVTSCLERDRCLTREALYDRLERAKVSTEGQRGIHILWRMAHERLICFGPRQGKQQTLVLFDEWVKGGKRLARDEALGELALRYFTGHGPATLADFAWWAGLTLGDARAALRSVEGHLSSESLGGGQVHYAAATHAPLPATGSRVHLLPAFDEFLVGYVDRSAALHEARRLSVNAGGGMLRPVVVIDGQVVGTWKRTLTRREVEFAPSLFEPIGAAGTKAIAAVFRRYADFLGLGVRGAA
jgi:hypothetical protein